MEARHVQLEKVKHQFLDLMLVFGMARWVKQNQLPSCAFYPGEKTSG